MTDEIRKDDPPTDPAPAAPKKAKPKTAKPKKVKKENLNPSETFIIGHDGKRYSTKKYAVSHEHVHGHTPKGE